MLERQSAHHHRFEFPGTAWLQSEGHLDVELNDSGFQRPCLPGAQQNVGQDISGWWCGIPTPLKNHGVQLG